MLQSLFSSIKIFLLLSFICSSCTALAAGSVIRLNVTSGTKSDYVISMINLAVSKIDKKYTIERDMTVSTQARIGEELASGNLDVMWVSTSKEKEELYLPIRIPLFKGLLGYRLLLIREGDQARFDNIKTQEDLKKFSLGQGATWADTNILLANGLNVVKVNKLPSLFHMLDGERFDAFPRGANEPFQEILKYPSLKLTVEKNLVLVYPMPFYMFVNKNNVALARDLELGLNRAIEDGSFEKLFLANQTVQDVKQLAHLKQRRIIYLDNPTLPKETPLDRPELWINPETF
jgi:Bacterial extracellular solute-binding proteins, family 3